MEAREHWSTKGEQIAWHGICKECEYQEFLNWSISVGSFSRVGLAMLPSRRMFMERDSMEVSGLVHVASAGWVMEHSGRSPASSVTLAASQRPSAVTDASDE